MKLLILILVYIYSKKSSKFSEKNLEFSFLISAMMKY
jgi:hypothetical protein